MYVRGAETEDILPIISLLREFAADSGIESASEYFSPKAVGGMISYSIRNGCCIIAVDKVSREENIVGVIMGAINVNPWTSQTRELRELAWYVKPEYRKGRSGIKLYNRYKEESRELIESGEVSASFMTTLESSGDRLERIVERDFSKIESHYMMGG
jgi:N-acetylglutamate synthase-like GNAT family acetyltransferase